MSTKFCQLNRRFKAADTSDPVSDAVQASYLRSTFGEQTGMDWETLLQKRITVIRGEPGCGKTLELKAKAQLLQQSGKDAFFLRLESIKNKDVQTALSESAPAFNAWLLTQRPAVFFLDAVDETRLEKHSDFGETLQEFKQALSSCAPHRIKLVISSRILSWRPHVDERELLEIFPLPVLHDRSGNQLPAPKDDNKVQVLDLLPLDIAQIKMLAQAKGLVADELPAFIDALESRSLWSFASRPLDVEWLVSYWLLHRCFGTLTEMIAMRDELDVLKPIYKTVSEKAHLRRAYYWQCVAQYQLRGNVIGDAWLFQLIGHNEHWQAIKADLQWLTCDALERQMLDEREQACCTALEIISQHPSCWRELWRLRFVFRQPTLRKKHFDSLTLLLWGRPYWRIKHWFQHSRPWESRLRKLRRWKIRMRDFWWLQTHLPQLRAGQNLYTLSRLVIEATEGQAQSRCTPDNWQNVIKKWGSTITIAAKQGCKTFWRRFVPPLPHENTDPSRGDGRINIGLAGIAVALQDGELRFNDLSAKDSETAFRYGLNEINTYTSWLPSLVEAQPQVAMTIWRECLAGEWRIPADRNHVYGVLAHLRQSGDGLAEQVASLVLIALQQSDPLHHDVLKDGLRLLCGLKMPPRAELMTLASERTPLALDRPIHHRLWMAIWIQTDALAALAYLRAFLTTQVNAREWMEGFCAWLGGRFSNDAPLLSEPDCHQMPALKEYLLLVSEWLRFDHDQPRNNGIYTPTDRDDAQQLRDSLVGRLAEQTTADAARAMRKLSVHPLFSAHADWMRQLIQDQQRKRADSVAWQPQDVALFESEGAHTPRNAYELFLAVVRHLQAIKHEVEHGNLGWREDALRVREELIRRWFADKLKLKAKALYTVSEESVVRAEKEMDICLQVPGLAGQVPIELKWEDNWTLEQMKERMSNQLAGQYLRAPDCHYGIFLIAKRPAQSARPAFVALLTALADHAKTLPQSFPNVRQVVVIGVDFTGS